MLNNCSWKTRRRFSAYVSLTERREKTANINVLTFIFSVWMSGSVGRVGRIWAVLHVDCCPETPIFHQIYQALHLLGLQKNRFVICAGVIMMVLHFSHRSCTNIVNPAPNAIYLAVCVWHLQNRPQVKKSAILQFQNICNKSEEKVTFRFCQQAWDINRW